MVTRSVILKSPRETFSVFSHGIVYVGLSFDVNMVKIPGVVK